MFELLQAYETAKHEKNTALRFIYKNYVRHKLKSVFFEPFKDRIHCMEFNKDLIEEFTQFYNCTNSNVITGCNKENPYVFCISRLNTMSIFYDVYVIRFKFMDTVCNIEVERPNGKTVSIHPENEKFYTSFFAEIIFMAIYNYCVTYIYGKNSRLYINNDLYIEKIKSMYY